jgi:hypothetical protein
VIDPHPGIRVDAALLDQPAAAQDPQVPADRGTGDGELRRQFAGPAWAFAQQLDDAPAGRVGERGERGVDFSNHGQHY